LESMHLIGLRTVQKSFQAAFPLDIGTGDKTASR